MSAPPHVQDEGSEHGLQKHTWPQPQLPHAIMIPENAGLREQPGVHVHVNSSKTALQNFLTHTHENHLRTFDIWWSELTGSLQGL